jgi:hypothetical protein
MRQQIPRLAFVIATAFLAGCVSDPSSPAGLDETPEYPESSAPETRENQPTSASVAEPGRPNEAPAPASERIEPGPMIREDASRNFTWIPFAFEGRTAGRVCRGHPYDSSYTCVVATRSENTTVPLEGLATLTYVEGTLTWDAATPSSGHLVVHLLAYNGERYVYPEGRWSRQVGESPLHVSFNLAKYDGYPLALAIGNDECMLETFVAANCALAGSQTIEPAQAFSFHGTLYGWNGSG